MTSSPWRFVNNRTSATDNIGSTDSNAFHFLSTRINTFAASMRSKVRTPDSDTIAMVGRSSTFPFKTTEAILMNTHTPHTRTPHTCTHTQNKYFFVLSCVERMKSHHRHGGPSGDGSPSNFSQHFVQIFFPSSSSLVSNQRIMRVQTFVGDEVQLTRKC